jgi:integrase
MLLSSTVAAFCLAAISALAWATSSGTSGRIAFTSDSPSDQSKPTNGAFVRYKVWYKVLRRAGVRQVRVHDLRHTYASLLLEAGEPMLYVKEQLGHSTIQTTVDLYGHVKPGKNREAVDRLAALTTPLRRRASAEVARK